MFQTTMTPNSHCGAKPWQLLSNGSRHLIRSDDMVETVYNERGEIIKTKERRLFLLNDVLMCATPNVRYERHAHSRLLLGFWSCDVIYGLN